MSWRNNRSSSSQRGSSRGGQAPAAASSNNRWEAASADIENIHDKRNNSNWAFQDDAEEDLNDSQYLQAKTRAIQDESLNSTRRALARLQQTEQVGHQNLSKMASQSDQLHRVENKLDLAEHKLKVSDAKADQLKSLSRFFMIPSFGGKKVKRKEAALKKEQEAAAAAEEERERKYSERIERLNKAGDSRSHRQHSRDSSGRTYTTPHGLTRDRNEEEIDGNLDQISSGLSRLKMMGQAMNQELDQQDAQLKRLYDKTAYADERVQSTNTKLNRILKK